MIRKSVIGYSNYGTWYYGVSMCRHNGIIKKIVELMKVHIEYLQTETTIYQVP